MAKCRILPLPTRSGRPGQRTRPRVFWQRMPILLALLAVGITLARSIPKSPPARPVLPATGASLPSEPYPLRFHVAGNTFVDPQQQPVLFRGMSAIDPIYQRFDPSPDHAAWNKRYYREMKQWCANIVRLPILPANVRKYGLENVLQTLDQVIAWAAEDQLYVIIDYHSQGWPPTGDYPTAAPWYATTPQEMLDFWQAVSYRYAGNDTVAFYELFNEPVTRAGYQNHRGDAVTSADWQVWKNFAGTIITAIRAKDPEKIILVGGLQFAYDLSFAASAPIASANVAYAAHPYSHPQYRKDWQAAFGELSATYPVFATEFGYDGRFSPDGQHDGAPYHQAVIDFLEAHAISWTAWVFDASWNPALLVDNLTFAPSPSGEFIRGQLLRRNLCP